MKKRLFSYLLAAALLLTLVPVGAWAADILYGDVNGDGNINAKDATLILRYSVGKLTEDQKFDEVAANVNADDRVNAKDATLILRYSVNKLDKFPADTHEHSYEAVVTDPTCTEDGYTTYTCSCGDSYMGDEIDALGHDWGSWYKIIYEDKCEFYEARACQRDNCNGYERLETKPCEHKEWIEREDGRYQCTLCRTIIEELPEGVHTRDNYKNNFDWVCGNFENVGTCRDCGYVLTLTGSGASVSEEALNIINEYRAERGLPPYAPVTNEKVIAHMKLRAEEMAFVTGVSHIRPDGTQGRGPCVGGAPDAKTMVDAWMNSDSHYGWLVGADGLVNNATQAIVTYCNGCWVFECY